MSEIKHPAYGSVEFFLRGADEAARAVAAVIMAGGKALGWTFNLAMSGVEFGLKVAKSMTGFKGSDE
ncbi:MAG: hypothetical protein G01um101416_496 [Microgenomates group bacterium Gr01-1014_16]|nr:MAG: hypothetical protein G01um101416_496 [Microgenomates group bacterium Gr01-1014_16]